MWGMRGYGKEEGAQEEEGEAILISLVKREIPHIKGKASRSIKKERKKKEKL